MKYLTTEEKKLYKRTSYVENQYSSYIINQMGFETKQVELLDFEISQFKEIIVDSNKRYLLLQTLTKEQFTDFTDIKILNYKELNELQFEVEIEIPTYIKMHYESKEKYKRITNKQTIILTLKEVLVN